MTFLFPPCCPLTIMLFCSTIKCPGRSSHRTSRPKILSRHHCCCPPLQLVPIRCKRLAGISQTQMVAVEVLCHWGLWDILLEAQISLGPLSTSISRIRLPFLLRIRLSTTLECRWPKTAGLLPMPIWRIVYTQRYFFNFHLNQHIPSICVYLDIK